MILALLVFLAARADADDLDEDDLDADDIVDLALAPGADLGDDVPTWATGAGEQEAREARQHAHTSPIGRVDVSIAWRRVVTEARTTHEVWLLGTWRL